MCGSFDHVDKAGSRVEGYEYRYIADKQDFKTTPSGHYLVARVGAGTRRFVPKYIQENFPTQISA